MRRDARSSESRRIGLKSYDPEDGEVESEDIESSVFPLRAPPSPMPSVGTRRSTRVFVPKAAAAAAKPHPPAAAESGRVLRSGKRFAEPLDKLASSKQNELLRVFDDGGGPTDRRGSEEQEAEAGWREAGATERPLEEEARNYPFGRKTCRMVYSRKRRQVLRDDSAFDRMCGIVYARNKDRKKLKIAPCFKGVGEIPLRKARTNGQELESRKSTGNLAEKLRILDGDRWDGFSRSVVLAVLVESSRNGCVERFARFLLSVLSWMRRTGSMLSEFVTFLFSGSVARVFSLHGVHSVPLRSCKDNVFSIESCGRCVIYGAGQFAPLISVNFSALPSYFKGLYLGISFRFPYIFGPRCLVCLNYGLTLVNWCARHELHASKGTGFFRAEAEVPSTLVVASSINQGQPSSILETLEPPQREVLTGQCSELRKNLGKKKPVGHDAVHNPSLLDPVEPVSVKPHGSCSNDFLCLRAELNQSSTPLGAYHRHRRSGGRIPREEVKKLNAAVAEIRKNIDSVRCNANILVTDTDRCWRWEGAEVMMDFAGPKGWCIAVRLQGSLKCLHKPKEFKSGGINYYTRANMWAGDEGWKLEFSDRWEWVVFKEIHAECLARNVRALRDAPVTVIPVPGVQEVSGYDDKDAVPFVRPETYIHIVDDEVERALMSNTACYDMDSGDEKWLHDLNVSSFEKDNNSSSQISEENFEKIIFSLEKCAYSNPAEVNVKERVLDLCENLGERGMVAAVYNYWLKKRKRKCAGSQPLVKVFQGQFRSVTKPSIQKKRSIRGQRGRTGRGKPANAFHDAEFEKAKHQAQEAEAALSRAMERAIRLRSRAQKYIEKADLAVYKSVMALRLAEACYRSQTPELANSILE